MPRPCRAQSALIEKLENRMLLASSSTLLSYDFSAATAWPAMSASASNGGSAAVAWGGYGTIDNEGGVTASNAIRLTATPPATGPWKSDVSSGTLAVTNTEANLGKLTLSFTLSASQIDTVKVYIYSYNTAGGSPTGGLQAEISPAAAYYNQRFAVDLSTMKSFGAGTFNPTAPFVSFSFEINSVAGWDAAQPAQLRIDNVNYSKPAYYVKTTGSNSANGLTEATAFRTPQKALDVSQPGDIILVMDTGVYNNATDSNYRVDISKGGTPAAWVTLKNYPGQTPTFYNEWWNAINVGNGSSTSKATSAAVAYVEVRGLRLTGNSATAQTQYPTLIGAVDARTNGNGLTVDGRFETNHPHDIRFADNIVENMSGGGIRAQDFDRIQIENNIVRNNAWWMIYAGSGISVFSAYNFDGTSNNYTRLVRNNYVYRNECFQMWASQGVYSDGNGIIIDVNHNTNYLPNSVCAGRTLVQSNVSFDNGGSGIHTYKADHVDIFNNTAYLNSASVHLQYPQIFANSSSDVRIYNNIMVAPVANTAAGEPAERVTSGTVSYFRNNVYFGGNSTPSLGTGDRILDPKFVLPTRNGAVADFRLQPTSPAINQGTTAGTVPSLDYLGNVRNGVPDIGAYEYYASTPTVVSAAAANPTPTTGSTTLTVVAGDNDGPAPLTYTWSVVTKPTGAADPVFSINGTFTAKTSTATFSKAGAYSLRVTVTDALSNSSTSTVAVDVSQTLTSISLNPTSAAVTLSGTRQFAATAFDQFGDAFTTPPTFTWTKNSGVGSINSTGLYAAPATAGSASITASVGAISSAAANITVSDLTAPTLSSAVSSKLHGGSGTFNLSLALGGVTKTIEPRVNGANKLIFTFSEPIKAVDNTISANEFVITNATFSSATISGSTLTLSLTGVVDRKYSSVTLSGISDLVGNVLTGPATLTVGNLYGDVSRNGLVSTTDQQLVKNALLQTVNATNFLLDANASGGFISVVDQQTVKNNLLHGLS